MIVTDRPLASVALLLTLTHTALADSTTSATNVDRLDPSHLEFGYDDAEAGFNGVYLRASYDLNARYAAAMESALLRGHGTNHSRVFAGGTYVFNPMPEFPKPLQAEARAGVLYADFDDDDEFGVLIGGRLLAELAPKAVLEAGIDWHGAGENTLVWRLGGRYTLSDALYLRAQYNVGAIDELTLGIGTFF